MIKIMKYGEVSSSEIFARAVPTVNVEDVVADIIKNVRERGDAALYEFSQNSESVCYKSGEAIVLYPCEAHLPNRVVSEPKKIKKAILKVALSLAK